MISFEFNRKTGIVEARYKGIITAADLNAFGENIYNDDTLPRKLKMLTDAREADYRLSMSDMDDLVKNLRRHVSLFTYIKGAVLQNKPKETGLSLLLENKHNIPNYKHKVFYMRQAAMDWLLNDAS